MRTAIIALVASVAVLGASPTPADAKWFKKVVRAVVAPVESVVKEAKRAGRKLDDKVLQPAKDVVEDLGRGIDGEVLQPAKDVVEDLGRGIDGEVLQPAKEELQRFLQSTKDELERSGEKLDDEVFQRIKKEAERFGRKIDDEVFQPAKEFLERCYERAEREPDPATKKARIEECNEKQTGAILGMVGVAVGAYFGPGGMVIGGLAGTGLGSAIDGAPTGYTGADFPISGESSSSNPAPDRTATGEAKDNENNSELPQIELDLPPGVIGRRLAYVSPDCEPDSIDPYNCEQVIIDLEPVVKPVVDAVVEPIADVVDAAVDAIDVAVDAIDAVSDTEVIGPLLELGWERGMRMRPLHPAEVIWILVGPTSVNEGADRLTEPSDDGKTGTTGTTPLLPSATATEPSADGTTGATLPSAQTPIPLARENETP